MQFHVFTAGTEKTRKLLGVFSDYQSALALFAPHIESGRPDDGKPWAIVPAGRRDELAPLGNLQSMNPRYSGGCFIVDCGGGVSCLGFDYAERKRLAVAAWLEAMGETAPAMQSAPGTPESWIAYNETMTQGAKYYAKTNRRCPAELTPELVQYEGKRVRVTSKDGESRVFRVGKSTGWLPIHLEIEGDSDGGFSAMLMEGDKVELA